MVKTRAFFVKGPVKVLIVDQSSVLVKAYQDAFQKHAQEVAKDLFKHLKDNLKKQILASDDPLSEIKWELLDNSTFLEQTDENTWKIVIKPAVGKGGEFAPSAKDIMTFFKIQEFGASVSVTDPMRKHVGALGPGIRKETTTINVPEKAMYRNAAIEVERRLTKHAQDAINSEYNPKVVGI